MARVKWAMARVWCYMWDWTQGEWMAHDEDSKCPWWHSALDYIWFYAHNNRFYRWLTKDD